MNFLIELVKRFLADTPWFFKVIRTLSIVIAFVTGLPELIAESGIVLPEAIEVFANKVIAIGAVIAGIIAQLTTTVDEKKNKGISD